MKTSHHTKTLLHNLLLQKLDKKIEELHDAISSSKESRDGDTKSSMGDKYETGREMAQQEINKQEAQLNNALRQKDELTKINLVKKCTKAEFGSLVRTSVETYFISIGFGKVAIDTQSFFAISQASPIGMLLKNKKVGDTVSFQGKTMVIEEIV